MSWFKLFLITKLIIYLRLLLTTLTRGSLLAFECFEMTTVTSSFTLLD